MESESCRRKGDGEDVAPLFMALVAVRVEGSSEELAGGGEDGDQGTPWRSASSCDEIPVYVREPATSVLNCFDNTDDVGLPFHGIETQPSSDIAQLETSLPGSLPRQGRP